MKRVKVVCPTCQREYRTPESTASIQMCDGAYGKRHKVTKMEVKK